MATPSTDGVTARNNTKVYMLVNGVAVGRVQSISEQITNNVQVLDELGRAFAVELKKGITHYSFSIAKFYVRKDVFEAIKLGQIFSLELRDRANIDDTSASGTEQTLEYFERCSISSLSRDYTVGSATVGENASVVVIGQGIDVVDTIG